MVKVTFLGTSASVPSVERGMPSIAIKAKELYIFDCGEGAQRQMMKCKIGFGSIKAIFISHMHLDHFLGVYGLLETLRLSFPDMKNLPVFAPPGFYELLINKWKFIDLREIKPGLLFDDGEAQISAFRVKHSRDSFGFVYAEKEKLKFFEEKAHRLGLAGALFKEIQEKGSVIVGGKKILLEDVTWARKGRKIVYSGDCTPSPGTLKEAESADLLIHEATYSEECAKEAEERNHSTASQAAQIAKEAGVKQLALTHISCRYKDTSELLKEAREIFQNTIIAEDGMAIDVRFQSPDEGKKQAPRKK